MTLRNAEYRILFSSKGARFYYYFAKDDSGWYQITSAGTRHKATAEQVLNQILPVLAKVKTDLKVTVEYTPEVKTIETSQRDKPKVFD